MTAFDVDARLDALYAGPIEEFVAARDALARDVAATGDRVGAARVKRLRRPTVAGWVVNQVVRAHPDDVAALVALGDELRAATADRDRGRIKALDHLRRQRTEALVRPLRAVGQLDGRPVSADALDRLTETLTAVVMDADAAAVVRAGRLEQALQHVGFGVVGEGGEEADVARLRAAAPEPEENPVGEEPAAASSPGAVRRDTMAGTKERAREDEAREGDGTREGDEARRDALRAVEREVEATAAEVDRLEALRDAAATRARTEREAAGREVARAERLGAQAEHLAAELGRLTAERDAARDAAEGARRAEESARAEVTALDAQLDEAEQRAAAARRARRAASARD
ncbi:conserved hypothetical protein [Xylanimonas cellulosilytica DSM 15894]|uniref:Uncharacterized protein n=1 Tax=Xylanimonas cellulosilytica (strain DSM 15894 / JCM 12276 / CECT 5975 / KCTC 9989 / LMG 20990 / NBRC 107835 / XIL07) TaxID=446471 RepID=D1BY63_XYLCX|nr:hypothetical protein [Xylanimonas cellulosilytica]ACZ29906.1 conserved hypothetical protein [Xylanimonas cellulosilytica DSM 15894]